MVVAVSARDVHRMRDIPDCDSRLLTASGNWRLEMRWLLARSKGKVKLLWSNFNLYFSKIHRCTTSENQLVKYSF